MRIKILSSNWITEMKIFFHNPHNKALLWQTIFGFLTNNKLSEKTKKYLYLIEYLNNNNIPFGIYLDYKGTSFPKKFQFLCQRKWFIRLEVYLWLHLKHIKRSNVVIIDDPDLISKNDILFSFSYETLDTEYKGLNSIINKPFLKLFHFSHYNQRTSLIAEQFLKIKWDYIIAENNLKKVDYFNKFFTYYNKSVYQLPFHARENFRNKIGFDKRKKMGLSIWGLVDIKWFWNLFDDLYTFYKVPWIQPLRAEILQNKDLLKWVIDTPVVPLRKWSLKDVLLWFFWASSISKYYNFDMCDKFNEYQMFLCCEEIWWLPWIWFVEWMASWCAYIWRDDNMYKNIWLIPWIHYIWHNGTLKDIVDKIKYYQSHQEELQNIAKKGEEFVNTHFRSAIIAEKFYNDLKDLSDDYKKCNYNKERLIFKNSFILK